MKNVRIAGLENKKVYQLSRKCLKCNDIPDKNLEYYYYNLDINYPVLFPCSDDYTYTKKANANISSRATLTTLLGVEEKSLSDVKKIYVHPSCKIPRTQVFSKYEKCLNPWIADAVIVPMLDNYIPYSKCFIIMEGEKNYYYVDLIYTVEGTLSEPPEFLETLSRFSAGEKVTGMEIVNPFSQCSDHLIPYSLSDLMDAELIYCGRCFKMNENSLWLADLDTMAIPSDRLVSEKSVMASLSNEENQIDCDTLMSIKEMIMSEDPSVQEMALKTLSAMDYIHYPQSVKLMFDSVDFRARGWLYNTKVRNAVSVKYMLKQLFNNGNGRRIFFREATISKKDWEVFKQFAEKMKLGLNPTKFCFLHYVGADLKPVLSD